MVTIQNAENALKTVYLGTVTELLNTRVNPLLAKIEQTSADVWGKEIRTAAKFGINGGIGAGDEDGDLPDAYGNNYLQFTSTLKNLYGQIEISDKAIRASADGRGAFTDLLNAELEGLLNASKFNLGQALHVQDRCGRRRRRQREKPHRGACGRYIFVGGRKEGHGAHNLRRPRE